MQCTWSGCDSDGIHRMVDRDGEEWAVLCDLHHDAFDDAIAELDPQKVVGVWARAGSGHPRRQREIKAGAKAAAKLAGFLQRVARK